MHSASIQLHRRYLNEKLSPGTLTAHERFCLVLLCSQPDTVHKPLPYKTKVSTLQNRVNIHNKSPKQDITPTVADCRYRAPLSPRLHGSNSIVKMGLYVKWEVCAKEKDLLSDTTHRKSILTT